MTDASRAAEPSQPDNDVDGSTGQPVPGARRPDPGEVRRTDGPDQTVEPTAAGRPPGAPPYTIEGTVVDRTDEPPPAPPKRGRRRVAGLILAVVAGVAAVVCLGSLVTGFFVYRKISEPARTTPGVTLRQYLDATLDQRDDDRADQFTCRATSLTPVRQLRDDLEGKEKQFGVSITSAPEDIDSKVAGKTATVGVKLRLSVSTNGTFQEQIQTWRFTMRDESGWRVCSGQRLS